MAVTKNKDIKKDKYFFTDIKLASFNGMNYTIAGIVDYEATKKTAKEGIYAEEVVVVRYIDPFIGLAQLQYRSIKDIILYKCISYDTEYFYDQVKNNINYLNQKIK